MDGSKMGLINGGITDAAVVWARFDDERVRGFIVPTGTHG